MVAFLAMTTCPGAGKASCEEGSQNDGRKVRAQEGREVPEVRSERQGSQEGLQKSRNGKEGREEVAERLLVIGRWTLVNMKSAER
ncbi:MAG: hypothetical protein MZV64_35460 [Ignavibacteriales bacterium]|nr:hypothetical protein [Ignavibacteriales bacterium]